MVRSTGEFILGCFIVFLLYWVATAFRVKRTAKVEWRWRVLPLAVAAIWVILRRTGAPLVIPDAVLWPQSPALGIVADVITLAGLVVTLWARTVLGGNWSGSVALKENHELIARGPYARVRHPIYSGVLLMGIGAALWYGRTAGVVGLVLVALGFWYKSRREERLLSRHFPGEYAAYRARTRAFVPPLRNRG